MRLDFSSDGEERGQPARSTERVMETPGADTQTPAVPAARGEVPGTSGDAAKRRSEPAKELSDTARRPDSPSRLPSIIVGLVIAAVAGLSIWYLVRPQPLLVQGEVDATRFDIAARVDGRVADIPVERGQDVAAGAVLVRIDNPETIAKNEQALAAKIVAEAQLANINAGTRAEVIEARKAALERAQASVVLAQKTYDRVSQLAEHGNAPIARLDQATDSLHESQRGEDLAKALKVGDRFVLRIPALSDRRITVEVRLIATKGEYASWRATRATGDFDLRTFSIRAYPVEKVPELRPGMSAYLDWR